jgi:copper chaperone CopZ
MKILFILILTLFTINKGFSHESEKNTHAVKEISDILSSGEVSDKIIDVATIGMVCDFCAQSIEKVFMKRKEVQGIKIDLNNQQVIIFLAKDHALNNEIIFQLFEDAGYGVENIERNI